MPSSAPSSNFVPLISRAEFPKLGGEPPWEGAIVPVGGAQVVYMRDIYFERNVGARQNILVGTSFV
jgi:hypothetical protein